MTLSGVNFNSDNLSPTTSLELAVACNSASWMSATMLRCGAASYGGGTIRLHNPAVATVSANVGTGPGLFSYDGAHAANASAGRTRQT